MIKKHLMLGFWYKIFSFFQVLITLFITSSFLHLHANDSLYFLSTKEEDQTQNNKKIINTIIQNNSEEIEVLLAHLFRSEPFAYPLYFDKPMAFCTDLNMHTHSIEEFNLRFFLEDVDFTVRPFGPLKSILKKGWDSLQTFQKYFNHSKYFFGMRKFNGSDAIFLINKQSFKDTVDQHIQFFQQVLGKETTAESLLEAFEYPNADIKKILLENEALLGILLGFGKHNSQLFELRENLYAKLVSLDYVKNYQKILKTQKKIDKLWQKLQFRNDYFTHYLISGHKVGYACDRKHPESIELENKYEQQAVIINQLVYKKNWIENILLQLL